MSFSRCSLPPCGADCCFLSGTGQQASPTGTGSILPIQAPASRTRSGAASVPLFWFVCRFYLGGPTSIRGFSMYSMGPQSEGRSCFMRTEPLWEVNRVLMFCAGCSGVAGDYLGGEGYWAGGLHLYTPLPFRPGRGGFGDLFRTHFFLNAGNLCNLNYGEWETYGWPGCC